MKKYLLFIATILLFSNHVFSQCEYGSDSDAPEELNRKRLKDKEEGFLYGNPYTMFNRHYHNNWTLQGAINQIRYNILANLNGDYAYLYDKILQTAKNPEPSKCYFNEHCSHPLWVKSNAIVYLVGLIDSAISDTVHTYAIMNDSLKAVYFAKANQGLQNLNPRIIGCSGGNDCGKVREKALDLIQYLEAYDLLKADGGLPQNDGDKGNNNCSARNKLRQFSRNLYKESNSVINSSAGWKKNHGIICCSALGMAAMVLNDAGVETDYTDWLIYAGAGAVAGSIFPGVGTVLGGLIGAAFYASTEPIPHPNYSPINWYTRAHGNGGYDVFVGEDGIEDNFFKGSHSLSGNVPQSSSDGPTVRSLVCWAIA